jgi:alpha-ketoglutarate-dependent taurine dioxygenase
MSATEASKEMIKEDEWLLSPISGHFGLELSGGHVRALTSPDWLKGLLDVHRVLVIRDQFLTHKEQVDLARTLGEPTPAHPVVPGHPDFPEILVLDGAQGGRNAMWHTDVTFSATPPAASVLVADHVPVSGGDTMWADLCTAFLHLSRPIQDLVLKLEAVHRITPLAYWGEPFDTALAREDAQALLDNAAKVKPVIHPLVRIHPRTGKPALFVNEGFTSHIVGFSRTESDGLLSLLYRHTTQPEFVLRHRWRPGDVLIWDNQATQHYAVDDYGNAERRMRRVTLRGDLPTGHDGRQSRVEDDPLVVIR